MIPALVAAACGGAPQREAGGETPRPARPGPIQPKTDDCAVVPGKPKPDPLRREYTGVARKARCDREVFTIMGGLTHFLGVPCGHCHDDADYTKMTHNKYVANWMASELIPSIQRRGGGEVWCNDCHVVDGKGTAKILRSPRDPAWTREWMTVHLAGDFDSASGDPLRCKSCHQGALGSPEFQTKIILTDHLPPRSAVPGAEAAPSVAPATAPAAASASAPR